MNKKEFEVLVANNIKKNRKELNISQGKVANRLECKREYVAAWETNLRPITFYRLIEISCLFKLTLESLTLSEMSQPKLTSYKNYDRNREDFLVGINDRVNTKIFEKKISIPTMQKQLGLSSDTIIFNWIQNISIPNAYQCYQLAQLFDVKFDDMVPFLDNIRKN